MALYNAHKRATLDRMTLKYQLRLRALLRASAEGMVDDMIHALEMGHGTFTPGLGHLPTKAHHVFEDHQRDVIRVAISDGIQEVSPERKLHQWMHHPFGMPVEDQLSVTLAEKRDRWGRDYIDKRKAGLGARLRRYTDNAIDIYLKNIRAAYARMAFDWLSGDGTRDEVAGALKQSLMKTDSHSEMILRTETTNYFNEARHEYFSTQTVVDFISLYAVTDGRISNICETRHGFVIPIEKAGLKKYMPAFHPHCRTVQRPLISSLSSQKPIIEKGQAMNESRFAPLPKGWA